MPCMPIMIKAWNVLPQLFFQNKSMTALMQTRNAGSVNKPECICHHWKHAQQSCTSFTVTLTQIQRYRLPCLASLYTSLCKLWTEEGDWQVTHKECFQLQRNGDDHKVSMKTMQNGVDSDWKHENHRKTLVLLLKRAEYFSWQLSCDIPHLRWWSHWTRNDVRKLVRKH